MIFEYKLESIGWADVFFEVNGQELYFSPSYLSDALGDLLNGLIKIIPGFVPSDELMSVLTFDWTAEPAICKWKINIVDENLHIEIKIYEDEVTEKYETVINTICNLKGFLEVLIHAMDILLQTHGLVGYKETWYNHEFPIGSYLKLKNYLFNQASLLTQKPNQVGIDLYYSNLDEEKKLM